MVQDQILFSLECLETNHVADGHCDDIANTEICNWDGGDCCGPNPDIDYCVECQCHETTSTTSTTTSTTSTTITTTTMSQGAISGSIIYGAGTMLYQFSEYIKMRLYIHFFYKIQLILILQVKNLTTEL